MLKRFNLNTRSKRLALIARHADPCERKPEIPPKELHIDASEPGEKVQMDCFLCRPPRRPQGSDLAIHRDRRRLRPHLGLPAPKRSQPLGSPHGRARPPGRRRVEGGGLEAGRGHHRQWLGVPRRRLQGRPRQAQGHPAQDQGRAAELKRLRGAGPAEDPRGVLAEVAHFSTGLDSDDRSVSLSRSSVSVLPRKPPAIRTHEPPCDGQRFSRLPRSTAPAPSGLGQAKS